MVDRIRQLIEYAGFTSMQFADAIEVPRAILSHILSGRNKPSLDVVLKVAARFPEVDLNWLLLGNGGMLKQIASDPANSSSPSAQSSSSETINSNSHEPAKVQAGGSNEFPFDKSIHAAKKVKQIVFFYTDNSFSAFSPEV